MIQRLAPSNMNATTYLIVVMGVSGSGKSSLARTLADYYGYCYLDGDDFHSESSRARMASGQPLTDEMRAPWVAAICQHLQDRARRQQHCFLAFSGLKKIHRNQLREAGLKTLFIFLRGDKHTIQDRLNRRTGHFMAPALLDSQLATLEDPSMETDVVPLDIAAPLATIADQAIQAINEQYELEELATK
ncbi:MAG TPA: gluconokinase [Cellvibrio sp.]|nr:gluconokinase [Cellvibrio sp.]